MTVNVVAIDGPAGSGKSTIASLVAEKLSFTHVDTGAMYRALTLKVLEDSVELNDRDAISKAVSHASVELLNGRVLLDGRDVTKEIRKGKVTQNVPHVAAYPEVRLVLLGQQRAMAREKTGIVMEGRDIGTIVFPDAKWKFYLDADPEVRALRRHSELAAEGKIKEFAWVLSDLIERDKEDRERPVAPLCKAADATVIDSSLLSIEDVVARIVEHVRRDK